LRRPDVFFEDITIRTSVRENQLTVLATISNVSKKARTVTPCFEVMDNSLRCLYFSAEPLRLEPSEKRQITVIQPWSSYTPWSPRTPQLYHLVGRLLEKESVLDERRDRFGFREVWTEGHRLLLNGEPIHLFGEWCHKNSFDSFRPEYVRQWYRMLKDCNMNYIRTHTYPHPSLWLDLADEMGILVSLESAWFFTHGQALDKEELWKNAEQHVRDIIARDKNHPSIILWSVGNEVRWGWNRNLTVQNMPRLRKLYEELDPTRIAYHDGDSSLWDEREQSLISRHYGLECTGETWWDKSKPLHVGEVGKWHYGQPIDNLIWGSDSVFASFEECHRVIARECADLAEQARANEVTCFFPWNLSGLDNWRPWPEPHTFVWPDLTAPGLKPLRSAPFGSEFAWWDPNGPGYEPGPSYEIMKHAFRPFAIVVREKRNQAFSDQSIRHTATLVNDTGGSVTGTLEVTVTSDDKVLWKIASEVSVANGFTERFEWQIPALSTSALMMVTVDTRFYDKARLFDAVERRLSIMPATARTVEIKLPMIGVFGDGSMSSFLRKHGINALRLSSLALADPTLTPLLLIEKDAIQASTRQNQELNYFLQNGGRVILLEQSASVFPQLAIDAKPVERVHIRGGQNSLLADLTDADFEYWGDDPYGMIDSDSWVVIKPYRKPTVGDNTIFLHSGYGDFGSGGLLWTPLFETRVGAGMMIACQLRITEKLNDHPAALKLMYDMLRYAAEWQRRELTRCAVVGQVNTILTSLGIAANDTAKAQVIFASSDAASDGPTCRALAAMASKGKIVLIPDVDKRCAQSLRDVLRTDLRVIDVDTVYNLVRWGDDVLLEGISHQETYWLDRAQYSPESNINHPMTARLLRCSSAEELLVSEFASAWREFFTLGANSELLRMPVMSSLLWMGQRQHAAGLLRLRVGQGEMLLCQVPFLPTYAPSRRFWGQLLSNLGLQSNSSLLDGEKTIAGSQKSDGFPLIVRCLTNPTPEVTAQVLSYQKPSEYRLPNDGLTAAIQWSELPTSEGQLAFDDLHKEVILYFQIDPGRPRIKQEVVGGLPDPNQQTLLSLRGQGKVVVYVNGEKHDELDLGLQGRAMTTDIDLHQYWNTVVLHCFPKGRSLGMLWHNRENQPEIEFEFN
jgi:beta-galactosidase